MLLFFETTIHSAGTIKSGKDRLLVVAGYTPAMFQPHEDYVPDAELLARVSPEHRALLGGTSGYRNWLGERRTRRLSDAAKTDGVTPPKCERHAGKVRFQDAAGAISSTVGK
jgi:hypothetical protein